LESYSVVEFLLSGKNISDFFSDLGSFNSVQVAMKQSFVELRDTKNQTEVEKDVLSKKQAAETDARKTIESEQRRIQANEAEKKQLLAVTKNQEKAYQGILSERQQRAAQIRSALFSLRDTAAIPFGTAYTYALEVQKMTGVRPAFLLAILTQETNLGENVGQCLVTNFTTGDGIGKNTGTFFKGVMKPGRDITPFLSLASRLGFDPKTKPVSCPQSSGYGGAMGPSQFIPSTWALYEKRIASASGAAIPDPWIPHDAFFATGLYLDDLGAGSGGYTAESTAAAKYYAGSAWKTRGKSYAASVMTHAQNIQENMIDPLQNL
jgi:membrane-bound lytic murein transglycosylase B